MNEKSVVNIWSREEMLSYINWYRNMYHLYKRWLPQSICVANDGKEVIDSFFIFFNGSSQKMYEICCEKTGVNKDYITF